MYMSMAIASLVVEGVLIIEVLVRMLLDLTKANPSDGVNYILTEITISVIQVGINYCFLLPSGIFAIKRYVIRKQLLLFTSIRNIRYYKLYIQTC